MEGIISYFIIIIIIIIILAEVYDHVELLYTQYTYEKREAGGKKERFWNLALFYLKW